ncbi:TPA: hypothetical protein GXZ54_06780 [bacterium]|nr:hypothetical protein [bacterium]
MKFNKIKYNIIFIACFSLINFLLAFLIFYICFYLIAQLSPLYDLYNSLHDNYVYAYNDISLEISLSENMKKSAVYYKFDYIEIDNEYRMVLRTNKKGIELGIPYFSNYSNLLFFRFNDFEITEKTLLTSNYKYTDSEVKYAPYFSGYKLSNYFLKIDFNLDYLMIDDDYFLNNRDYDLIIITEDTSKLSPIISDDIYDNRFITNGKILKNNGLSTYQTQINILLLLSVIPLIFSSFALKNMYIYYLKCNKNEIIINYIFYKSYKKNVFDNFVELFTLAFIPSFLALVVVYILNNSPSITAFIIALLLLLIIEIITIYMNSRKQIYRILSKKDWRNIS